MICLLTNSREGINRCPIMHWSPHSQDSVSTPQIGSKLISTHRCWALPGTVQGTMDMLPDGSIHGAMAPPRLGQKVATPVSGRNFQSGNSVTSWDWTSDCWWPMVSMVSVGGGPHLLENPKLRWWFLDGTCDRFGATDGGHPCIQPPCLFSFDGRLGPNQRKHQAVFVFRSLFLVRSCWRYLVGLVASQPSHPAQQSYFVGISLLLVHPTSIITGIVVPTL